MAGNKKPRKKYRPKPYAETAHQLSKLTGIPWSTAATI